MNRFVFDASAAFEYLARTPTGIKIDLLTRGSLAITAGLIDVEVIAFKSRCVAAKILTSTEIVVIPPNRSNTSSCSRIVIIFEINAVEQTV